MADSSNNTKGSNLSTVADDGKIVPIHDVKVKRGPGRPRKVEKRPTSDDLKYHAEMAKERIRFVENHELVTSSKPHGTGNTTADKLNRLKHHIAREVAVLEFNRQEAEKRGVDTTQTSSRIINSLKQIADVELEIKKLGHTVIDPNCEEIQRIFRYWLDILKQVMSDMVEEKALTPEAMDLFFNRFSNLMDGWEDKVGLD